MIQRLLSIALALSLCSAGVAGAADEVLVPLGSTWRYLDTVSPASSPPAGWNTLGFNDPNWAQGPDELGYGDGGEATTIGFGPNSSDKYRAAYFRHTFTVADPNTVRRLVVGIERDDGAVVYLNGVETFRTNMPAGSIDASTFAASTVGGSSEGVLQTTALDESLLVAGDNVVAVEVHQATPTSSDLSFRLELVSAPPLSRGPYLQRAGPDRMTVRWRTSTTELGRVRYGPDPAQLTMTVDGATGTEHEIELTGLTPGTRYFYSVETASEVLAGADPDHFFRTAPPVGTDQPTRVWVIGDSGEANQAAADVRDDFLSWPAGGQADVWLMLGDNAYNDGTDQEYQQAVFDTYPSVLRSTPLWPAFGNHDAHSANSATEEGPYFDIFTLPRGAESGGTASGTEAYYSFDHANVHFMVLDTQGSDPLPTGAMMTWAAADLASTTQDWVIVTFHHPPYTKGSHDSDSTGDSGGRLVDARQLILPILEQGGVDLVLAGHSHVYERSMLLDGHYGFSSSFSASTHGVDTGDGCFCPPATTCAECALGGNGPYDKPSVGQSPHEGAVYSVVGSSSKATGSLPLDHPAMVVSLREIGAMIVDVSANRLDAVWIQRGGTLVDRFTLRKADDEDGDGVADASDVCPYTANPGQAASACLCGDVDADGDVDVRDVALTTRNAAALAPGVSEPRLCPLGGCAIPDANVIRRQLALLTTLFDTCPAAQPAPCGDGVCAGETDDCPMDCGCSAPTATCAGAAATPGGCFCDASCVGNGDCCIDACEVCGFGCEAL